MRGSGQADRKRWLVLGFICLAIWINAIDATIVNVALADIGEELHASNADLQWVLDAFNVTVAGVVLLGSGLVDRYGRKLIMCLGLIIFILSSALAAVSSNPTQLIGSRVVMGIGVSLVMPASLSIITLVFTGESRKVAVACWAAVGGLGLALGPVLGGLLLGSFSWGLIFWVNVPAAAIALIGVLVLVAESRKAQGARLDPVGGLLSLLGLGGLVFGIIEGPNQGWSSVPVITAAVVAAIALPVFVYWELHHPDPMFDVRVLRIPEVAVGAAALAMIYFVVYTLLYLLPQSFQYGDGMPIAQVGLALFPLGFAFAVLSPLSPRILRWIGLRWAIGGGYILITVCVLGIALTVNASYWVVLGWILLFGVGWSQLVTPATAVVMDSLPLERAGDGASVNQVSRQVGGAIGVAVVGSIVTAVYSSHLTSVPGVSAPQLATAQRSLSEAATVSADLPPDTAATLMAEAVRGFDQAFTIGLIVTGALSALVAFVALYALRHDPAARVSSLLSR